MNSAEGFKFVLDDGTKEHIARVLWLSGFDHDSIPREIIDRLYDPKNSLKSFGSRTRTYLAG